MCKRLLTTFFLFASITGCRPAPLQPERTATMQGTSTPSPPSPAVQLASPTMQSLLPSPGPSVCLGEVAMRSLGEPTADPGAQRTRPLSSEQLAQYLNIVGIDSLCIPHSFGAPSLNVDWNNLENPPNAIGRMISIGFEGLDDGASGWGRGFIVYSTYDFEVGSEYDVFATEADLQATRTQSMPRMVSVDGIDGFVRYIPGISMDKQPVYITYIFPFDMYYLAAALTLGQYDPAQVNDVILQMEQGRHPDLVNPDLPHFNDLVSSIQFK